VACVLALFSWVAPAATAQETGGATALEGDPVAHHLLRIVTAMEPRPAEEAEALERAGLELERGAVLQHLRTVLPEDPPLSWRRAALELLTQHAAAEDLSLLGELVLDPASGELAADDLVPPFRDALVRVLRRAGADARELHWLADRAAPLRSEVIRAVGESGRSEGLAWLGGELAEPALVAPALREIARLAEGAARHEATEVAPLVRPFVQHAEPGERRHAVRALGVLEDVGAVPLLIDLLEQEGDSGLGRMAHASLQRIAGWKLPPQAGAWRSWYGEQDRWWREQAPLHLEHLTSEDDARVVAAVHALSAQRLFRHEIAQRLAGALGSHPSAAVRGQLCLGLARLGSRSVVDGLVRGLEDEDLGVREHALAALRSITGLGLPPAVDAWEQAL
jgi:hypothetical protein